MNKQFLIHASPAALAAIALMPDACHRCPTLRKGHCTNFRSAAGDPETHREAMMALDAAKVPVNEGQEACADLGHLKNG